MKQLFTSIHTGILLLLLFLGNPGVTGADNSVHVQRQLTEVLSEISERYQVIITYDAGTLKDIKVVYQTKELPSDFESALKMVMKQTNLEYKSISAKYYVVYRDDFRGRRDIRKLERKMRQIQKIESSGNISLGRKQAKENSQFSKVMESVRNFTPDNVDIAGTVTDEEGNPLIGVNIQVKGTTKGTSTDFDGNFFLTDVDENAILIVSYIGHQSREVQISNSPMFIVLRSDAQMLDAVVVTALGISREKRALGYSVGEVSGDQLNKVPQENALNALTGKVAGLKISNPSLDINSDPQVIIRGAMSLSGDDAPLIVIDGLPTGNNAGVLSDLGTNNIESVSVLKGPSAAALYGSRAGNGVLIVTTKNGSGLKSGLGVSVNSSYSASKPYHFMELQDRFATGRQGAFDASQDSWFGPLMGTNAVQWNSDGAAVPLQAYPDNVKNFVQTGHSFINEVGVHGNLDKVNFNISFNDTRATGTFPGLELNKNTVGMSLSYQILENLKVSANGRYATSKSDNFRTRSLSISNYPFEDVYAMPNYIDIREVKDYWRVENIDQNIWDPGFNNPWFTAYENIDGFRKTNPYGNIKLDWDITSDLSLMGRIGTFNETYVTDARRAATDIRYPLGRYNYASVVSQETNMDFLLSYKKEIGKISGNISGGGNSLFQNGTDVDLGGENLVLPGLYTGSNIDKGSLQYGSTFFNKRVYSLYGMASIDYDRFIYLELTGRNDWSSTLPVHNRSYFYPSASLSVILSDMLELPSAISLLKLRGGWAQVGKDTKPYQLVQLLDMGVWGDRTMYSLPVTMANSTLEPESVISTEWGMDLSFFNNRIGLEATYYEVENRGQIMAVQVPTETGFTFASENAGVVQNKGIELKLHTVPVQRGAVVWDLNLLFTKDRSKLLALPEGISNFRFWSRFNAYSETSVGGYIGELWGNDVMRVKEGPYKDWPLVDDNGLLQLDPEKKKIGNIISDFMLGFQTNLSVKRFTLSANIDWRQGGKYFSESMERLAAGGKIESWYKGEGSSTFSGMFNSQSFGGDQSKLADELKNNPEKYNGLDGLVYVGGRNTELGGYPLSSTGFDNGVFFPGVRYNAAEGIYVENFGGPDTRYTPIDNIAGGSGYSSGQGVQTWIYDASYVKLRELALSYTLPQSFAGNIKAQNISLSAFTKNIILWTKAQNGIDPESAGFLQNSRGSYSLGWERSNMDPWTAVMGLKLNVEF